MQQPLNSDENQFSKQERVGRNEREGENDETDGEDT